MRVMKRGKKATLKRYDNGKYVVDVNVKVSSRQLDRKNAVKLYKRLSK